MSATSEYERTVQQDYGPTTSNEHLYEHEFVHPLIEKMDVSNVRPQILRAVPLSPTRGDPEPDSTNPESIIHSVHNIDKDVKYHITEKRCDSDMSVDTLPRIVRFEESNIESVSRISYPVIQGTDDSGDGSYGENTATLIQAPLNAAIVHNVTKLPQNFTINVDATVGNIATIQNVSQDGTGNQTLWLPTILTTNASDNKNEENRQSGVSQIIITSESYINNTNTTNRRGNIITEASYIGRPKASKVQILSNISIPKNTNYSQQYVAQGKEITSPVYAQQNHIYKLSPNLVPTKHVNNNIQSTKPPKSQSLISASTMTQTVINSSPAKNVPYSHTYTKSTNVNKVNNGANLNAIVAASSGNTHCHILSRVVSGPNKLSVHSGRKGNALKGSKNSQNSGQGKNPRSIKIIQQTGNASKSENKTWPVASVTYKGQSNYNVETSTSMVIQKIGSPTHKNQQSISLQKVPKGERLVLQSPCGPVLISTAPLSSSLPKGPHYVQSGSTANLQYVQTYGGENQLSTVSQISANQQLTAQILQSLSQPKLMLHQGPSPLTPVKSSISPIFSTLEEPVETKPPNPKRIVFGDKTTLMTADDIIGVEERPNLFEELRRYSFQPLAFVMLDHTYALPAQKLPTPSTSNKAEVPTSPIASAPPIPITTPMSPLKRQSPTVITSVSNDIIPTTVATTTICAPMATTVAPPIERLPFKPLSLPQQDDDTASIISSVEGERRPPMPGGSDTETAPEGEEEGKTRCICDFTHDDGYMICCDRCGEWQHVDCMGIDRNNIPDAYMCELCMPRTIDRRHARIIQLRKREELNALAGSDSDSNEYPSLIPGQRRKRLLTVTTYTNTSGTCVTTYNSSLPVLPSPTPQPTLTLPKRGPKQRPKKTEVMRKGTKRKLAEKRVKRKKELMLNKSKFNSTMSSQPHWRDLFEQAMTNHYSPELRAKIMKYSSKLGNTSNMSSAITAHLCTTVPHAGGKILIATKDLRENTPVIELRGKYMLSNQHRPQLQNSARAGSQKPGPFVFFYRLPKDNTQICIDTRTYGNEARFVRRSCKPNAELQHCIVKGTLHVYLATITDVQSNTEITVGHDTNGAKQPCACGNPKHCKVNGLNTLPPRKSVDISQREKRSRNRCLSSSSPMSPPPTVTTPVTTPVKEMSPPFTHIKTEIKTEKKSPIKHEFPPMSPPKESYVPFHYNEPVKSEPLLDLKADNQEFDLTAKEEMKSDFDEPDYVKSEPEEEQELPTSIPEPPPEPQEEEIKPIEKEIKKEVPVKVQNVEKEKIVEIEKKEEIIEKDPPMEIVADNIKEEPIKEEEKIKVEEPKEKVEEERPMTREFSAKSACHDRSSRSSRTCNKESDSHDEKTDDSQDKVHTSSSKEKEKRKMTREERKMEAIMKAFERMEKAQQRKQEVKERQKRRESDPHPTNFTEKDDDDDNHCSTKRRKRRKGRARTASQSNRRRLNSADSDMLTSGDEAPHTETDANDTPENHDTTDAPAPPRESLNEDLGLSSACLLVEAAVGSVESAFKLPKTKKTMATEWIGRSPDRTPSPYHSPYRPALVTAPSLESLVRVASTMIGEIATKISGNPEFPEETPKSPPRTPGREKNRPPKKAKRVTRSTPTVEVPEVTPRTDVMQHSAKKRWLRQAISEESDAPSIETFVPESPPSEMVTPLKKRRLARESLSCDQNPIVPCNDETSPSLALEDSPVKDDSMSHTNQYSRHNIMDYYSRDRTRSDSGQGSDDQCNIDHDILNVNIKGPHDSENIRRIIGVPTPEEELPPPVITKPEDIETTNNNNLDMEESNYNKVVPMDIDTTVIAQTKLESNENSNEVKGLESPNDKVQSSQSADTSGNSSPQRDEMDDIQKKIHSFHTENILILKSRNKKPPKEKRKKVNLNFDLNMVDDQISIQLRTENTSPKTLEVNGDLHDDTNSHDDAKLHVSPENIPLPPVESTPLPPVESIPLPTSPENIPLPEETSPMPIVPPPETIPLPEEPMKPKKLVSKPKKVVSPQTKPEEKEDRPSVIDSNSAVPFSTRFSSTGLFSGIFSNMSNTFKMDTSINDNIPNMSIIKSAIDRTTSLDGRLFDKDSVSPVDDLKSVQEILTRVNNMDSNNSVILSGVLRGTTPAGTSPVRVPAPVSPVVAGAPPLAAVPCGVPAPVSPAPLSQPHPHPVRSLCSRALDPRLNPPPVDKPKPVRRKLSISEYRLRQLGAVGSCEEGTEAPCEGEGSSEVEEWSRSSASLSPQRLEAVAAAAADDLEQRLHRDLQTQLPAGVFDAQPTASERQREDLSSRLRLEYGLALPDDDARAPPDTDSSRRAR
ncbi:uncharacterized protein LOC121730960 isoform X2 [Aricia agestis]|uniref:uncharacterized protein LOC121730960 isoform X2 n=1 Tax=Aricia agestis TaxID=91739 RepID=UPI001C2053BE|nr:uncharacterized protein LOC121730960 isoform X2 [Aricia agestis]